MRMLGRFEKNVGGNLQKISAWLAKAVFSQKYSMALKLTAIFFIAAGFPVQGKPVAQDPLKPILEELSELSFKTENYINKQFELNQWVKDIDHDKESRSPRPPRLPRNFRWKGRYIVSDLIDPKTGKRGINVPFTWHGKDGNIQMIAGSEKHPIYFTNLIYNNHLYTYTYKWPGLQPEFLPPLEPCVPLLEFSLEDLNAFLRTSRYVGPEILEGKPDRSVHHFRAGIVLPQAPSGFHLRFPIALADIYVDQKNPRKFWQVLHFGLQNIYDPELDEWIVIHKMSNCPGEIDLPPVCLQ